MARRPSIEQIIANLPPDVTPDTVIPSGPHAGQTVGQMLQSYHDQEGQWSQYLGAQQSGDMTLEEALNMALSSPNPESFRVPYGPFQGMGVGELIERANQQRDYLTQAGILPPTPEEPGLTDMFLEAALPVGQFATAAYIADAIKGAGATTGAAATAPAGAAATGAAPAGAAASATGATAPAAAGASMSPVPGGAGAAANMTPVPPVAPAAYPETEAVLGMPPGPSASPVNASLGVPGPAHNYGLLGLNPAPGTTLMGSQTAGAMLPYAGLVAGAYTGYNQLKGAGKLAQGKDPSALEHAALFPITGGFDAVYDYGKDLFGGHRHKDVYKREGLRDSLGDIYQGNNVGLSGGRSWDIGSMDQSYNLDWDKIRGTGEEDEVSALDALVRAKSKTSGDERAWQVGELYNAANSGGADSWADIQAEYQNSGMSYDQIRDAIRTDPDITESERKVWLAQVDKVQQYSPTQHAGQKGNTLPPPDRPLSSAVPGAPAVVDRNAGRPAPSASPTARQISNPSSWLPQQPKAKKKEDWPSYWGKR